MQRIIPFIGCKQVSVFLLTTALLLSAGVGWGQTAQKLGTQTDSQNNQNKQNETKSIPPINVFGDDRTDLDDELTRIKPVGGDIVSVPSVKRRDIPNPVAAQGGNDRAKPFGSQLFINSGLADRSIAINPGYKIVTGDRIAVRMWGARNFGDVLIVDLQGNIFLPEIGPVRVAGVSNEQLNQIIKAGAARVFTDNVRVYSNLLGTQPVSVFVSGAVPYPGRYPGNETDSLLYYLARAGGVDPERGSYRDVSIKRKNKVIVNVDFYDFLTNGEMPITRFKNNDVIVVGMQRPTVTVIGEVRNKFRFEFDPNQRLGRDILRFARPKAVASHASVQGVRGNKAYNGYMDLAQFALMKVRPGDHVELKADRSVDRIIVSVTGNSDGPSSFSLPRQTTLGQFANIVPVDTAVSDLKAIFLRRKSVAARQKQSIERALYELQRSTLTKTSDSATQAAIRVQEAKLAATFVSQVRAVEPEGRVVLAGANWRRVKLEQGDEIVIPNHSDLVLISGEVKLPQTVVWRENASIADYIADAGGLSPRGDDGLVIIIRKNGSVHDGSKPILKGDHIMVLPEIDSKAFAIFKDIIEVIYRVALSAAVVVSAGK